MISQNTCRGKVRIIKTFINRNVGSLFVYWLDTWVTQLRVCVKSTFCVQSASLFALENYLNMMSVHKVYSL